MENEFDEVDAEFRGLDGDETHENLNDYDGDTGEYNEYVWEDEDHEYYDNEDGTIDDDLYDEDGNLLPGAKGPLWRHVVKGRKCGKGHGGSIAFKCRHCHHIYNGSYTCVQVHLMGAPKAQKAGISYCSVAKDDRELQAKMRRQVERFENASRAPKLKRSRLDRPSLMTDKSSTLRGIAGPLSKAFKIQEREEVDYKVVRFLTANGIPFNVLRSPYWEEMVSAISQVSGYKAPSSEKARTTLLDNENERVRKLEKSGKNISEFLLTAIESIGPSNVVQVITDNAANCKAAGHAVEKAYKHIFWSPCMVHTLNLILKDLAREFIWMKEIYVVGKDIVKYVTNHSQALAIFRSHSKLELLKVAKIRFASHYITLKRLLVVREALLQTVVLDTWRSWT
ncbi:uncharacterized protein LOC143852490 [Tasmannia lanceolata]|uniref:uncharacterized protein LOC143852490 n=1 Tax=Tasmannia lanceolata TaxID=3420 RepID=UPI00406491E1